VVVRDVERYTGSSTEPLPVLEVHQMCGRAGRPGLDPYGEAVLVGDPDEAGNADRLRDRYVGATPEAVESKLADRGALRTHVLSTVASGFADTRAGVRDLLDATFYAHQAAADGGDGGGLDAALDDVLGDLVDLGMVERGSDDEGGALAATPLGVTTSRQYLRPETGARIASGLRRVAGRDPADVTRLTALELVCSTPDMRTGYLGNRERAAVYQFARDRAPELTTRMGEADDFEGWLEAVKTARILLEYADGASVDDLVEAYRIGPGDLESRLERAGWLLGAVDALVETLDVDPSWAAPRELRETFREAAGPGPGPDSGTDGGGDQDPGTAG
jgi:helicase